MLLASIYTLISKKILQRPSRFMHFHQRSKWWFFLPMKRIHQFFFATFSHFHHFQQLSSTDMEGESVVILIDISEVLTGWPPPISRMVMIKSCNCTRRQKSMRPIICQGVDRSPLPNFEPPSLCITFGKIAMHQCIYNCQEMESTVWNSR